MLLLILLRIMELKFKKPEHPPHTTKSAIAGRNRFFIAIFILTLSFFFLTPLLASGNVANFIWVTCFNCVIFFTIWMMTREVIFLIFGLALALPNIGFSFLSIAYSSIPFLAASKILLCLYILYSVVLIAKKVLDEPIIDTNLIFGSIMVYFLAGIFWSRLYWLGDMFSEEATFHGLIPINYENANLNEAIENQFNLLYYSFTTLATLGIGDIVALNPVGRVLSITEAVFGQLFIATIISKLVSVWRKINESFLPEFTEEVVRHIKQPDVKIGIVHPSSFIPLFVLVSTIVLVAPLIFRGYYSNLFLQICFNLFIALSLYTFRDKPAALFLGIGIAVPFLIFDWLTVVNESPFYMAISIAILCAFLVYAIFCIANRVLNQPVIDTNLIVGVIMIYLLAGLFWSKLYWLTNALIPGSFSGVPAFDFKGGSLTTAIKTQFDFFYYSFTTSATVGFGDISPVTHVAKSLTVLEAVFGQLFVATTVAKMVSAWRVN